MLTVKHTFKLYDIINKHFKNEDDSRTFVSEIEEVMDNKVDLKMNDFSTRKDLNELHIVLKQDIVELRAEVKGDIAELRTELKGDIAELRSDFNKLDASINLNLVNSVLVLERTQKEQLKWLIGAMFAFITLAVAVIKLT